MRRQWVQRVQRVFGVISLLTALAVALLLSQSPHLQIQSYAAARAQKPLQDLAHMPVALLSGHAGYDSGAVCTDAAGQVIMTEAEINRQVADQVADHLEERGYQVIILGEYDARMEGLRAKVFLSMHADSCIEKSGYKAVHRLHSIQPSTDGRLVACIDQYYPAMTGLEQDVDTITPNMTEYHAFRKLHGQTPAAILEMGFLGHDQTLLTDQTELVAAAIVESLLCFLDAGDQA